MTKEVEEYKELANNRLQELDKLHQTHRETLKEVEKLKMDVSLCELVMIYLSIGNDFRLDNCLKV